MNESRQQQILAGQSSIAQKVFNNRSQSWPVTFTGLKGRIKDIMDFLDRHKGAKGFLWEPPLGELGLYKCNGYKPVHRGGQVYAITATFQQTFHP